MNEISSLFKVQVRLFIKTQRLQLDKFGYYRACHYCLNPMALSHCSKTLIKISIFYPNKLLLEGDIRWYEGPYACR